MANYKLSRRGLGRQLWLVPQTEDNKKRAQEWRAKRRGPRARNPRTKAKNQPSTSPSTMAIIPPGRQNAVAVVVAGHTSRVTS